ncbi:hypothetical protein FB451DRAFT_107144 [Mycena latifolia]|nr:hypothetical protein FB451DRAFT_107144 [Mycena latifolia]
MGGRKKEEEKRYPIWWTKDGDGDGQQRRGGALEDRKRNWRVTAMSVKSALTHAAPLRSRARRSPRPCGSRSGTTSGPAPYPAIIRSSVLRRCSCSWKQCLSKSSTVTNAPPPPPTLTGARAAVVAGRARHVVVPGPHRRKRMTPSRRPRAPAPRQCRCAAHEPPRRVRKRAGAAVNRTRSCARRPGNHRHAPPLLLQLPFITFPLALGIPGARSPLLVRRRRKLDAARAEDVRRVGRMRGRRRRGARPRREGSTAADCDIAVAARV